jgi:hypothetical protein
MRVVRAACAIFGWEEPPELEELLQRIEATLEASERPST